MATKSEDTGREKLMWIAGTAAVTAFVVFQVNKYLREKDQLAELKAFEKLQSQLPAAPEV
jgi:hypothetical protein